MQTRVYDVAVWHALGQSIIDDAVYEWQKCVEGRHFEQLVFTPEHTYVNS